MLWFHQKENVDSAVVLEQSVLKLYILQTALSLSGIRLDKFAMEKLLAVDENQQDCDFGCTQFSKCEPIKIEDLTKV